jgi:putative endonuclease
MNTRTEGSKGEEIACDFLISQGYSITARNWRCRQGEIDIIVLDPKGVTAFVEVKQAKGSHFGHPESWVNLRKQKQLYKLANIYLRMNKIYKLNCRFDVITIEDYQGEQKIRHLKNAFIRM